MKWEAGKEYRIRAGCRAKIYEIYPDYIHSAYFSAAKWRPICWKKSGQHGLNSNLDLMPPAREVWIWDWGSGDYDEGYSTESACRKAYSCYDTGRPVKFRAEIDDEERGDTRIAADTGKPSTTYPVATRGCDDET